jgi:hypothetical protein
VLRLCGARGPPGPGGAAPLWIILRCMDQVRAEVEMEFVDETRCGCLFFILANLGAFCSVPCSSREQIWCT